MTSAAHQNTMELSVSRSVLHAELAALQGVVPKRGTIPILSHILLHAEATNNGGTLTLSATDLELNLVSKLDVGTCESGGIALSAKKLSEIVRSLPDEDIHLTLQDKSVKLTCGRSTYHLSSLPQAEFPVIEEPKADTWFILPYEGLTKVIGQTIFAITTDESRFAIPGGLFVLAEDTVAVIGTDGHRLAYSSAPLVVGSPGPKDPIKALLPRKTLVELKRLAERGENVSFAADEHHVFFKAGDKTMISRLLEGEYPDYMRVIPKSNEFVYAINRQDLLDAIHRVAIMAGEHSRVVRVALGKTVELSAGSAELGDAAEFLPYEGNGHKIELCLNARYVSDFLSVANTDIIELRLHDAKTQALFVPREMTGQTFEETDYRYVLMPMRSE